MTTAAGNSLSVGGGASGTTWVPAVADGVHRRDFMQAAFDHGGRWLIASGLAAVVALSLALLMSRLVEADHDVAYTKVHSPLRVLDFIRTQRAPALLSQQRRLPPRPRLAELQQPVAAAPALPPELFEAASGEALPTPHSSRLPTLPPSHYLSPMEAGWEAGWEAGDLVDVSELRASLRIDPVYPPFAERQGIEGWVWLSFAIAEDGSVVDARVIDADPQRVFDRAALVAVSGWRYRPQTIDGRRIRREGVEVTFKFRLE